MTLASRPATTLSTSARLEMQRVAAWISDRRRRSFQPLEPWPSADAGSGGWSLAELLHDSDPGGPRHPGDLGQTVDVLDEFAEVGLLARQSDRYRAGRWHLTAAHGVYAVRDRPADGTSQVFLSDDGLRLLDTVIAARPIGDVLDAGCGAGVATAGAALSADHVHGIDLVPDCLEATRLSAHLSGIGHKVSAEHADLASYQPDGHVDCIIANLPRRSRSPGPALPARRQRRPGWPCTHPSSP